MPPHKLGSDIFSRADLGKLSCAVLHVLCLSRVSIILIYVPGSVYCLLGTVVFQFFKFARGGGAKLGQFNLHSVLCFSRGSRHLSGRYLKETLHVVDNTVQVVYPCIYLCTEPTQPKSQDKPSSATAATQNGEKEEEEERWGEEEEEEKGEEEEEEEEVEENIEEEEEEEEEEEDGGPPPLEVATQPASLPSSLLPSTTTAITNLPSPLSEGFHSLPSLPGQYTDMYIHVTVNSSVQIPHHLRQLIFL